MAFRHFLENAERLNDAFRSFPPLSATFRLSAFSRTRTFFMYYHNKTQLFGIYKENINYLAKKFWLITAHCQFCLLKSSTGLMFWTILRHAMKGRPSKMTEYSTKQLSRFFLPFPNYRA